MAIFVSVIDETSFRSAAKKLSLSPSIVSLHIKKLEQQIGAPLLYRSTRALSLTREGEQFYKAATAMVAEARSGLNLFAENASTTLTDFRIAIPQTLTSNPVFARIASFAKNHKGIRMTLVSSDVRKNLLRQGHDLAIQMGKLNDSELRSKKIGEDRRVVVAAPSFLAGKATPKHPNDLKEWEFISFSPATDTMVFRKSGHKKQAVEGKTTIIADSVQTMRCLALEGVAAAAIPYHEVQKDLVEKRLIQVLPDWTNEMLGIFLVWPRNADLNFATREFINYLSAV
ncbi:MAG: hypothetical protein COB36_12710 [Alphaproteobacteria bacterium]|nr:MAG: hypothetical protein COB36_12710 [Alphaproteobacteria bacterium]